MTPEGLAGIRYRLFTGLHDEEDGRWLLAEVDRLLARQAAVWDDGYEKGWQDGSIGCTTPWENPHRLKGDD